MKTLTSVLESPNRHARRREKVFGDGKPKPMSRNIKLRVTALARVLMRPIASGKHYGEITAKHFAVLQALLWSFHNAASGLCFPSYEAIAEKAGCALYRRRSHQGAGESRAANLGSSNLAAL